MKNNNLLLVLLIMLFSILILSSANAENKIVMKCGLPTPETAPHYKAVALMNEYLAKKDLIEIDIYPSNALGTERELPESVSMGTVDMAAIAVSPLANFSPSFYMLDFPYLVKDRETGLSILNSEIGRKLSDTLLKSNIYVLGYWDQGFRQFQNNVRPVKTVEDARGLKIRVIENELYQSLFSTIGVYRTIMSASEVITALEQGTIDGLDVTLTAIYSAGYYVGLKYVTITDHVFSIIPLLINLDLWNSFSEEVKEELRNAFEYSLKVHSEYMINEEEAVLERLKNEGFGLDYADMDEWAKATSSVHEKYLNIVDKDIYTSFEEAAKN